MKDGAYTEEDLHLRVQAGSSAAVGDRAEHRGSARSLGVVEQTLWNWTQAYKTGKLKANGRGSKLTAEQIEIRQLRAEVARLKMERDILGKAAAYFSGGQR